MITAMMSTAVHDTVVSLYHDKGANRTYLSFDQQGSRFTLGLPDSHREALADLLLGFEPSDHTSPGNASELTLAHEEV